MQIEAFYQDRLDFLYQFIDFSLTKNLRYSEEKFNLERMVKFMALFGNPQNNYPIIHIAGSKGKGSTSAMIHSALVEAGYKVGFYTSPHLHDFCERIKINHAPISHSFFVEVVDEMKPYIEKVEGITTFELMTALAFISFAKEEVDYAVIEVGLGGRLDATNIVDPLLSVITSLSLDHVMVLGDTLAKIAYEKGGIIKPGKPVVIAPQKHEARVVLKDICEERGSELIQVGHDYRYAAQSRAFDGQSFLMWPAKDQELVESYVESGGREDWEPTRLQIPLLGFHQVQNAATAYTALQKMRELDVQISEENIRIGFSKVSWPGRFEILDTRPYFVVDSAHNRESALRLRQAIDDYFPGLPIVLVFGASEDKDIAGMFAELLPRVKIVVATKSYHPRSIEPEKIKEMALKHGMKTVITEDIQSGLQKAYEIAGNEKVIIGTGSIFVAAGLREEYYKNAKQQ